MKKFLIRNLAGKKTVQWHTQNDDRKKRKYSPTKGLSKVSFRKWRRGIDFQGQSWGSSSVDLVYKKCFLLCWLAIPAFSRCPQERPPWASTKTTGQGGTAPLQLALWGTSRWSSVRSRPEGLHKETPSQKENKDKKKKTEGNSCVQVQTDNTGQQHKAWERGWDLV